MKGGSYVTLLRYFTGQRNQDATASGTLDEKLGCLDNFQKRYTARVRDKDR